MTLADQEKICRALSQATGLKVAEIYPEFFLSAKVGGVNLIPMPVKIPGEQVSRLLLGVFLARELPDAAPRPCKPIHQWGCN